MGAIFYLVAGAVGQEGHVASAASRKPLGAVDEKISRHVVIAGGARFHREGHEWQVTAPIAAIKVVRIVGLERPRIGIGETARG